jgi:tRNA(fMet)-specific endonuclease VapC
MAEGRVLIDTNVFISSFRGNKTAKLHIDALRGRIAISTITVLELYRGARTVQRKEELTIQLKAYHVLPLDVAISLKAEELMRQHVSGQQDVFVADCLIAATSIVHDIELLTYNRSDFDFMKELRLYTPSSSD